MNANEETLEALRFPIGRFEPRAISDEERAELISEIGRAPGLLRAAVEGLTDAQLDTSYRPDGWTVRQVVHHLPDSHMNSYMRFKLAIAEDRPTIRTYDEASWGEMSDARRAPPEISLVLLDALHARWVPWLRSLPPDSFARQLDHPEWDAPLDLDTMVQLYAWHGQHHTAHITGLRDRMGW